MITPTLPLWALVLVGLAGAPVELAFMVVDAVSTIGRAVEHLRAEASAWGVVALVWCAGLVLRVCGG